MSAPANASIARADSQCVTAGEVGNAAVGTAQDEGCKVAGSAAVVRQSPPLEKCKVLVRLCGKRLAVPHSRDHRTLLMRAWRESEGAWKHSLECVPWPKTICLQFPRKRQNIAW